MSGLLNKQAAAELGISEVTLQIHRGNIMKKMEAGSLAELVRMAGMLEIPMTHSRHAQDDRCMRARTALPDQAAADAGLLVCKVN